MAINRESLETFKGLPLEEKKDIIRDILKEVIRNNSEYEQDYQDLVNNPSNARFDEQFLIDTYTEVVVAIEEYKEEQREEGQKKMKAISHNLAKIRQGQDEDNSNLDDILSQI